MIAFGEGIFHQNRIYRRKRPPDRVRERALPSGSSGGYPPGRVGGFSQRAAAESQAMILLKLQYVS